MRLETKRLILRPVTQEDHQDVQNNFPHWDIVKYLNKNVPWPYPPDGAKGFLEHVLLPAVARGDAYAWAITRKESPEEVIGLIEWRTKESEEGSRGFWLALPHHGKGYMTEAVAATNDYAFDVLGFVSVTVKNARGNAGSRRVKEKTGAILLRTSPSQNYLGGYKEEEVWELTAENWRRARGEFSR